MAQLGQTFDINDLPQGTGGNYDPVPPGWYTASITQAEVKPTKDGTGQYIKIRYDITGPAHQGRVVFGNLNIRNASAKAEEIGRQQLAELMRAIGLPRLQDTDELIGANLGIKLDIRAATEQYAAQNEVRGFKALDGAAPPASKPAFGASSSPATPAKAAPPWAKR